MSSMMTRGSTGIYNSLEVVIMDPRQKAVEIIKELSEKKVIAALYILEILAKKCEEEDGMINVLEENIELLGNLKVAESAFADWDNEEDAAYDQI
ncbi:MAG: hypothetical protein VR68_00680 [Peptococcaceae bacterium BRH_c4a]|nr:MAG: hypothetical protein VR68_00680 [Peptococcaceae bacterium BRH_c4a]